MSEPVSPQPSFRGEVKDFVLAELRELGTPILIGGLESVLLDEAGLFETTGVTPAMRDGSAAAVAANADMVAMVLGYPPQDADPDVVAALQPLAAELRATAGLADLADRAVALVEDRSGRFAGTRGECGCEADFVMLLAEIRSRLADARTDHPGQWHLAGTEGGGVIRVTMYPATAEEAGHG